MVRPFILVMQVDAHVVSLIQRFVPDLVDLFREA